MSNKANLKIDWASHKAAKYACENWHYSQSIPCGKLVKIGAWENDDFIGVVLFGRGANNNMLKEYGLPPDKGCELVRIALRKHQTPVSRIMSIAIRFLKKSNPNLRLIVSYSDIDQNHHGGIYQATNWIYTGASMVNRHDSSYIIKGKRVHGRNISDVVKYYGGLKGLSREDFVFKYMDKNAHKFITKGKHKYLMPLTKEMRKKIESLAKPYPKRRLVEEQQKPSVDSGATPTPTLQYLKEAG